MALAACAFALYYALQCIVALSVLGELKDQSRHSFKTILFSRLALLCLWVFVLGFPSA